MKIVSILVFVVIAMFGCSENQERVDQELTVVEHANASAVHEEPGASASNKRTKMSERFPKENSDGSVVTGLVTWHKTVYVGYMTWGNTKNLRFRIDDQAVVSDIRASIDFVNVKLNAPEPEVLSLDSNKYLVKVSLPDALEQSEVRVFLALSFPDGRKAVESLCFIATNLALPGLNHRALPKIEKDKDFDLTDCSPSWYYKN